MKTKIFSILLILIMAIPFCSGYQSNIIKATGNTLYVGGSGSGNYTTIQSAIDNASTGDTVFVYDDSSPYYENVLIDKPINLIGENNISTIIDGEGVKDVVYIISDCAYISGFTIQNSSFLDYHDYSGIASNKSSYCIIEDCLFLNCHRGMKLLNFNNSIIRNNFFKDEPYGGLLIIKSVNITLERNTFISESNWGIFVDGFHEWEFNHTIDESNTVNGVPVYYFYNIYDQVISGLNFTHLTIAKGSNITIEGNNICNGDGLHLAFVNDVKIVGNNINYNYGIGVLFLNSTNNIIEDNIVQSNMHTGIDSAYSSYNLYKNNTIENNRYLGIGMCLYGSYNEISGNRIYNNLHGVYIGQSAATGIAGNHHNIIKNNRIYNNGHSGVLIYSSHDNYISNNTIYDNHLFGIGLNISNYNTVNNNNLVENNQNTFDNLKNHWDSNYYDDWIGLRLKFLGFIPYRIPGTCLSNLDWHPAKESYDIP